MKKIAMILAVLIALIGMVWFGQGIGVIHGSVMTDDSKWAIIGAIMIVVAAGIFWFARRRR
jgi:LPXTG-motif cell wall-anchored protein